MQDSVNRSPPPPKPEVRDGSLASLLNNDVQPILTPPPSFVDPMGHSVDFSMDFINNLPLDNVLNGHSMVDWVRLTRNFIST